jgi:hypothetical protein
MSGVRRVSTPEPTKEEILEAISIIEKTIKEEEAILNDKAILDLIDKSKTERKFSLLKWRDSSND